MFKTNTARSLRKLKSLSIALCIGVASLMQTGCAYGTRLMKAPVPASLTQPCPKLPKLLKPELGAALSNHVEVAEMYYECAARHNALGELVK